MSRWLVIGAGGFVASHLIDYLLEQNEEIIGTVRWNEDLSRITHFKDKIKIVSANLLDLSSLIRVIAEYKPDKISLLAAESYVNDSFTNPIITIETNTIGTVNLFEAIRLTKDYIDNDYDPIIHVVSSSEVYGKVDEDSIPITTKHPFAPGNPYAIGKIGEDATAQFYNKYYGFNVIITRMFTHCGLRRTMMSAENNFAKQIAKFEKSYNEFEEFTSKLDMPDKSEYILKHGNLDSVRTWADVRDAVRAYYIMVDKKNSGKIYNIGGNTVKTIGEMLDHLISLSPIKDKIKKELDPALIRKLDVNLQIMDNSEFLKDNEWEPEIPFEKTMEDLLDWWRKNV